MLHVNSEDEIRAKVMQALSEALPYKQTLSLRLLITYCVDGGAMKSCVIDEILSKNSANGDRPPRPMDLSTPKSSSPPVQIMEPNEKPIVNTIPEKPQPLIWDQMKNILNTPLNPNFIDKENPLLTNNPFLPLLNPTKPLLDNDLLMSLIDKLNHGKKNLFNPAGVMNGKPFKTDLPTFFNNQEKRKNVRKDTSINGGKAEKKMRYNRNFNCNQCKANFNSLADLNRHTVETHSTFKCTICSASFTQRSNLQRHSLKHVGFKPFTCALCKKEYYRKDHLMRHIEVTHPHVDPKSSIITHLTSSECLEYLEKMNLSHSLSSNNQNFSPNTAAAMMNPANGELLQKNDSNNNTASNDMARKPDEKSNPFQVQMQPQNQILDKPQESVDPKPMEGLENPSSCHLEDPEDLDDDDDLHNEDSDYEREDCVQVNIDFSDESHLMRQTLDKSFEEADIQRQDERITFMNESIYDSGEMYRQDHSDEEGFEGDPGESEAAVATLQLSDDQTGEDSNSVVSHRVGLGMEIDEKAA